ncbi:site-specific DNA-methyltransferase [uncultured Algibacter sp.]|uniref:DNA methyltransferase n=1 Tax=uncultured Algibacter sp. TaxID=298659 RepID=UPI002625C607|nr:site-specific DNA-methyltransferase [uncultured Algibacter sp.]
MKLYQQLEDQLKQENDYITDEGELKKWVVINKAQNFDEKLISLLLEDAELKETFFLNVKDTLIFNQNKFIQFLEQKNYLNDSYTQYRNKVGLNIDGKFLKQRNEVSLVWPFKDCVLEGGQSREEDKREEIFFNEILAQDEITQLLEPKVLTNAKTFDKDGEHNFTGFTRNAEINKKRGLPEDTITDNLIIKGNNLLALHSLKKEFAGKVKLIYIDPPYNTENDSFTYNDSFNHSTWLTFMKNRLEIAKRLLKKDGVIFISCDDNEYTYLKSVCDEVFGIERFENIFHVKVRHENRILRKDIRYQKVIEQLLSYGMPNYKPNRIFVEDNSERHYRFAVKINENAKPKIVKIGKYDVEIYNVNEYELLNEDNGDLKEYNIRGSLITQKGSASEYYELNLRERKEEDGLGALYRVIGMGTRGDGLGYRYIRQPFDTSGSNGFYYQGKPISQKEDVGNPYPNYYDFEKEFNLVASEGGVTFKNGKKPELFLKKIMEIGNIYPEDILLDFHIGSGSSMATAHKLGFQYIGCEQMTSQIDLSLERLQNVINGDTTGISKEEDVNWKGGGSFKYLELRRYNQIFVDQIKDSNDTKELLTIWEQMKAKSFLNYNVDIKKQDAHIEDFKKLDLKEQKEHLVSILDKNQLFVNVSSLNDAEMKCTDEDKKVTQDFYQINKA